MQRASRGLPTFTALEAWTASLPVLPKLDRSEPWKEHFESEALDEYLRRMTEECLDDVGMAWHACIPRGNDTWRGSINAEKRLLAQLDAVLCLGPELVARLENWLPEIATPHQFFAFTLIAACVDSELALLLTEQIWSLGIEQDDEVLAAITEALWRSANPKVVGLARARLAHPDPRIRASAIAVLDARGEACGEDVLTLLTDTSPVVLAAVARALRHPEVRAHQFGAVNELLAHQDERVVAAALRTTVCKRLGAGRARAKEICEKGSFAEADAALVLALFGDERDLESFQAWLGPESPAALLTAIGYFGAVDMVPSVIAQLSTPNEETRGACAQALARITGAELVENVDVPLYEEEDKPFVDNPEATRAISRTSEDPKVWSQWWSQHRPRFLPGYRYRLGRIYDAHAVYDALDRGPGLHEVRSVADLELRTMAGHQGPHLVISDWFARQSGPMQQWRQWAESAPTLTRGWFRARA